MLYAMALNGSPKGMNGKALPMAQRLVRSPVVKLAVNGIQNGLTHKEMMLAGRGLNQKDTKWFKSQLEKASIRNSPFTQEEVDEVFSGSPDSVYGNIDQLYADKGLIQCPTKQFGQFGLEKRDKVWTTTFGIATLLFAVGAVLSGTLGEHYGFLRVPQLDRQVLEYCDPTLMAAACRNRYQICPDANQSQGTISGNNPEDDIVLDPSNPLLKDCIKKEHWIYKMFNMVVALMSVSIFFTVVFAALTCFAAYS